MRNIFTVKQDRRGADRLKTFRSGLFRRHPGRTVPLIALVLCLSHGLARAGDMEDCNSGVAEKVTAGCTAVINNAAHTSDEGVRALVNRARMYTNTSKFDLAL